MPTDSENNEQGTGEAGAPSRKLRMDYVIAAVIVLVVAGFIGREWLGGSSATPGAAPAGPVLSSEAQSGFKQQTDLGLARYSEGKFAESEAAFRKSIEYNPQSALGYNNLGSSLNSQSKFDEAITVLQKAVTLDPNLALARNNLAYALSSKAKLDGGITAASGPR
jgi:tetratricopeptide (TPR) repeat protein